METLRYYEKQGLVDSPSRTDAGYRLYSERAIQQIEFIISAKNLGFSLKDIQELLNLRVDKENHTCEEVKTLAEGKLEEIEDRIKELSRIQNALKQVIDTCCGGPESADKCSILSALEQPYSDSAINSA
ncbi:MAG: Zn(2+)-responsive transcriptional regulator [Pseudomonadales bacterium]|nr:Zn(2+)-responsive transcriptional regulator [Pseudomonadales bacterium]